VIPGGSVGDRAAAIHPHLPRRGGRFFRRRRDRRGRNEAFGGRLNVRGGGGVDDARASPAGAIAATPGAGGKLDECANAGGKVDVRAGDTSGSIFRMTRFATIRSAGMFTATVERTPMTPHAIFRK